MRQDGDDLGDDFVVDDLVTLSGDEDTAFDGGEEDDSDRDLHLATDPGTEKKRKRREKEKARKAKVCDLLSANYVQLIRLTIRNESSQKV